MIIENAPRNVQRLYTLDELGSDRPIKLTVYCCNRCGFVQIQPILGEEYYDDYMMVASHSKQMQEYQGRQAAEFVARFQLAGKSVKEIGCGDGSYLDHLKRAGAVALGIEPSQRTRDIALTKGHAVEAGYVSAARLLEDGPYDAFVTRQVLEHVPDIHDFLMGIRLNLRPGAVGLVEVPSLEKALADSRYYDFFSDHVNYFSFKTLRMALELNGFEVLEMRPDMFGEYDVAVVRNPERVQLGMVQGAIETLGRALREFISEHRAGGKKVAMWGAGGKGLSVLAAAGIREIDLLVDSDPNKQGRFTPVSHLKVEAPSALVDVGVDAVIITAMAYWREIHRALREKHGFRGVIAVLGKTVEIVEP
jgi:SAM-dependent methyltransferase